MTCINCGAINSDDSVYCGSCGVRLTSRPRVKKKDLNYGVILVLSLVMAFLGTWLVTQVETEFSSRIAQGSYIPEIGPFLVSKLLEDNLDQVQWTAEEGSESHLSNIPARVWVRGINPYTQEVLEFSFSSLPRKRTLEIVSLQWGIREVPLWEIRSILMQMSRNEWNPAP